MGLKIAYIGDILNHGKTLQTTGTSIIYILSTLPEVDCLDVYCPRQNNFVEDCTLDPKIRIVESYHYDSPLTILKLMFLGLKEYNYVIFNLLPTGFGNSVLGNAIGLMVPLFHKLVLRLRNIRVIYHNSVFTNDIRQLGYSSLGDGIKAIILGLYEKFLFKFIETFVLLELYKERIDRRIGRNKVTVLKGRYLEAVSTIYLNNLNKGKELLKIHNNPISILLHGSWGPQKNLELALEQLMKLKSSGFTFHLILSGIPNYHFPEYKKEFEATKIRFASTIDEYLGYIKERDILRIFLSADLILLPYNTPGGHSGVLEQSLFFDVPTIAIDFPEYQEQAHDFSFVILTKSIHQLYSEIKKAILTQDKIDSHIIIDEKMKEVQENLRRLIH